MHLFANLLESARVVIMVGVAVALPDSRWLNIWAPLVLANANAYYVCGFLCCRDSRIVLRASFR
jgi:hypothetical protein